MKSLHQVAEHSIITTHVGPTWRTVLKAADGQQSTRVPPLVRTCTFGQSYLVFAGSPVNGQIPDSFLTILIFHLCPSLPLRNRNSRSPRNCTDESSPPDVTRSDSQPSDREISRKCTCGSASSALVDLFVEGTFCGSHRILPRDRVSW